MLEGSSRGFICRQDCVGIWGCPDYRAIQNVEGNLRGTDNIQKLSFIVEVKLLEVDIMYIIIIIIIMQ